METDGIDTLKGIPFAVYALAEIMEHGSTQRELVSRVGQAVRHDIDRAVAQWESERKEHQRANAG